MKKFFTLVAMALMAVGANAQTKIYEADFTGITEFTGWSQFGDGQEGSVGVDADGIAITVGSQTGQLWQPQVMIVPDNSFALEEDGNYKVIVTAKFPTNGTLQINMGDWSSNDQTTADVTATGDFQEVEVSFEGWAYTNINEEGAGTAHLLFQCGDFLGTTIVKHVEIYDMSGEPGPGPQPGGDAVLFDADFTGIAEFTGWSQFGDGQEGSVGVDADGIAITVGSQTGQLWQPQVMIIPDNSFALEEDGNYQVTVTAKFPTNGTLQINMGDWSSNDQTTADVTATGDFQDVTVDFDGWAYTNINEEGAGTAHLLFQCGDFLGTTIVKHVTVINKDASGIKNVKANKALNNVRYNLAGQKVDASYKGIVIQNGKKFIQK